MTVISDVTVMTLKLRHCHEVSAFEKICFQKTKSLSYNENVKIHANQCVFSNWFLNFQPTAQSPAIQKPCYKLLVN